MEERSGKTIGELSVLAGVSVRTLHHYDRIGLLVPEARTRSGYRVYSRANLLRLQQILLWRSLDMPLEAIARELDRPDRKPLEELRAHRERLLKRRDELDRMLGTIDRTLAYHEEKTMLSDEEMYDGIRPETATAWREEARERWGSDLVSQSEKRVKAMGKDGLARVKATGAEVSLAFVAAMKEGPGSPQAQEACSRQWEWIRNFYEPSAEVFAGLGAMYRDDPRFSAQYEEIAPGLASFMADAMAEYSRRLGYETEC